MGNDRLPLSGLPTSDTLDNSTFIGVVSSLSTIGRQVSETLFQWLFHKYGRTAEVLPVEPSPHPASTPSGTVR